MKIDKQIFEWLGGLAVVASLLLVAYEIRQNTKALSAQAIFDLNQMASNNLQLIATDPDYARLYSIGDENPEALDPEQWTRYQYAVWAELNMYEAAYVFFTKGIINQDEYHGYLDSFCDDRTIPGYARFLEANPNAHFSGFYETAENYCSSRN